MRGEDPLLTPPPHLYSISMNITITGGIKGIRLSMTMEARHNYRPLCCLSISGETHRVRLYAGMQTGRGMVWTGSIALQEG
jgi:hypothetical protein